MIKRYSRKELTDIWSEENKYKIWLDVEVAAAQAMEKLGQIPRGVSSVVRKKAKINVKRIHQIESQVKHDVIAFLTSVTEKAGVNFLAYKCDISSKKIFIDKKLKIINE